MKVYTVTYDTKENRKEINHLKLIFANNTKQARERFDIWYANKNTNKHAFHIKVRLAPKSVVEGLWR